MSNTKDRAAAHIALAPKTAAPGYAEVTARLPRAQIAKRRPSADRDLPAVGSFN